MRSVSRSFTGASDFDQFLHAHFAQTVRSVARIAGADAEDVAQEAFVAALMQWDHVAALEAPDGWVRLVARRMAWRRRTRELRWTPLERADEADVASVSADPAVSIDLENELRRLPDRQRAAIQLHYLGGLPVSTVAALLGCRTSTAKVWLHRGRRLLAEGMVGHRGRWVSERRWSADDIRASLVRAGDGAFSDIVLDNVATRGVRWVLTLDRGRYLLESDDGERHDDGRYVVRGRSIALRPRGESGIAALSFRGDGNRARFEIGPNSTAPTSGVPDDVYLRLLLGSSTFIWTAASRAEEPAVTF